MVSLPEAQFALGSMYELGNGVAKNRDAAFYWYQKAAVQGHAIAQYNSGAIYEQGTRQVTRSFKNAAEWYRKAATQGDAKSQFALGLIYEKGKGVKKDLAEAAKWYGEAAAQGDAEAIRKVAKLKKLGF